jgi:sugar (pentulose or hexulose) kinase
MMRDERFDIRAVNFSAYGASFVYLDENAVPILPLYNYLKPYPENLKRKFYDQYEGEVEFSKKTASPVLGSLNSGMQLYKIKYEKPEVFSRIKYALHLPQYLSSILTKRFYSEITSIGCHTNLWDFTTRGYHEWVVNEGLREKLPPTLKSNVCVNTQYKDKTICIGVGLHDSSSALIPYLINCKEPFVLVSTGTWCISLNPFNNSKLNRHELGKDCLCYLSYQGLPVKASRLFAGYEHEQQARRLAECYNIPVEQLTATEYNKSIAGEINGVSSIERLKKRKQTHVVSKHHTNIFN